jgi:hypothetical protein
LDIAESIFRQEDQRFQESQSAEGLEAGGKNSRPTHRDNAAMNGAQTSLFAKHKRVAGSMNGPFVSIPFFCI